MRQALAPWNRLAITTRRLALALTTGLLCMPSASHAWKPQDDFINVPFMGGKPMVVEGRLMAYHPAGGRELRMKRQGVLPSYYQTEYFDPKVAKISFARWKSLNRNQGIQMERYYLISANPDVLVSVPFQLKVQTKIHEGVVVLEPGMNGRSKMYEELISAWKRLGISKPLFAEIRNQKDGVYNYIHNYVELACAFEANEGMDLFSPVLGPKPIPFDDAARALLLKKTKLNIRKHPTVGNAWQLEGCPV
jgi:hypothetical protein